MLIMLVGHRRRPQCLGVLVVSGTGLARPGQERREEMDVH